MKIRTKQLAALFDELEVKYIDRGDDCLGITIATDNYVDHADGLKSLLIVAHVDTERKIVRLSAVNCIDLTSCDHREKVSQLLLWMNFQSDLPRFELDLTDYEVRCAVSTSYGESFVDAGQLDKMLSSLIRAVDANWEIVEEALKTGKLPDALYEKHQRLELADLIRAAGGVEGLREILSERGLIN